MLIGGCSRGESNVSQGNREQVFHKSNNAEPQGLDPHVVTGVAEHHIVQALFEGLVSKNPHTLEIEPAVAESWALSEDGKVYTFKLRQNANWSNGDPVTAHDFAWSWWRALQPALGSQYVFMYFPIKNAERYFNQEVIDFDEVGIKALDDYTLRVELANPTPYFMQLLDHYSTFPVHRATIEKWGKPDESYTPWTRPENIVTNGPFVLDEWRLNKHLMVRKNDAYWGADQVRLQKIVFYPYESGPIVERMFRAGQLHYTYETFIDRLPWYRANKPDYVQVAPYAGTYLYRVNTTKPHLADKRVRKALAMTIDRQKMISTILNDLFTPAYAITPPGLLGYQPPKLFDYDPDAARALLAEAGYPNGEGFPETELQYNSSEQHRKIAIAVQQMWNKELNINIRLQNKDWKVYLDDEQTGNYDISRGGWIADYVDPNSFLDMWVSGSGLNRTRWANPRYDELVLQRAPEAKSREDRYAAFYAAETMIMQDMPFIPIYTYSSHHFKHPAVRGMPPNIMSYYNWRYVWLDPDWSDAKPQQQTALSGGI
ncbi:MAG: peptide ABC transporter substrate-binding protein [Gammaproteobacteria bacterium]|nr:peptide ABC transporter substrate-binding protein [Gammaproteobacteria bacterium]